MPELISRGKLYPWPRPCRCPRCDGGRLWSHGYVRRYFDGVAEAVWVKRWRCPDCRAVHTCRPASYWRRFLAPSVVILASLSARLTGLRWPRSESRQRQQYWYRGYVIQSRFGGLPPSSIDELLAALIVIATHSIADRASLPVANAAHRSFAATAAPLPP